MDRRYLDANMDKQSSIEIQMVTCVRTVIIQRAIQNIRMYVECKNMAMHSKRFYYESTGKTFMESAVVTLLGKKCRQLYSCVKSLYNNKYIYVYIKMRCFSETCQLFLCQCEQQNANAEC